MKKPPDSNPQATQICRPGTTLDGQAWRGQLKKVFYHYHYQLYQLGTAGRTQKDLACTGCLPKAIGA